MISGPADLETPFGVERIDVRSNAQMLTAVEQYIREADVYISTAAIADFRPGAIKELNGVFELQMAANPDILKKVGELKRP